MSAPTFRQFAERRLRELRDEADALERHIAEFDALQAAHAETLSKRSLVEDGAQ